MPADIIGWAVANKLELVTVLPPCKTEDGDHLGIVAVSPACLMPMFRRDGSGPAQHVIYGIRAVGSGRPFKALTEPAEGIVVHAADIMITTEELERFEEEHGIIKRPAPRGGGNARWDWEAFWLAVLRRVHNHGLPETQRALALEMQEWFARRHPNGDAPEERTIMRKLSEMWRELREDEGEEA